MSVVKKHPLEMLLALVLLYAIFRSGWSGPDLLSKLITAGLLLTLAAMIRFAWEEQVYVIKLKIFTLIHQHSKKAKIEAFLIFAFFGLVFTLIEAVLELVVFLAWKGKFPIVIGFPYPIYSFSVYRFLYYNIFLDTLLNGSILFLISSVMFKDDPS